MAFEKETKKTRGPAKTGAGKGGSRAGGAKTGGKKPAGKAFGDKPRSASSRNAAPRGGASSRGDSRGEKAFGDRKPRSLPREGARSSRTEFNDRPKRSYADRPARNEGGFEDRPRRSYDDRPKRDFGDRPPRREGGEFRPRRESGEFKPRREGGFEDRPRRSFDDRPKRDFGDRPPRREGGEFRPRREGGFEDSPKRSYSDRPRGDSYAPKKRDGFEKRPSREAPRELTQEEALDGVIDSVDAVMAAPKEARGEPTMMGHEMLFYGVHAVQAALRNPNRSVTKIWVTESGQDRLNEAFDATRHPEAIVVQRRELDRRLPEGAVHQGLAAAVEPLQDVFLSDVVNEAIAKPENRQVVVVLDEVTDPHNVGAILRSMSAFGAKAMIVHKRNAPGITGVMAKTATGALEHIPMIPVTNLSQALEELKLAGFYVVGLDERADFPIQQAPADGPIALVLGAEGEGLRAKTRTTCNAIASIETFGDIQSLNVSNAAAIALFALTQKR